MNRMTVEIERVVRQRVWESWNEEQQTYVLVLQFEPVRDSRYFGKRWELDKARPQHTELCPKCYFDYCFYAMPRNYTIGDADVYNLMKCANVACQFEFQSCL
jgi:hypothetical protein